MQKKYSKFFLGAIGCFFLMALVILFMPLDLALGIIDAVWYDALLGILFYLTGIMGIVCSLLFVKKVKRDTLSLHINKKLYPGVISFFRNSFGAISDVILGVSIIGFTISMIAFKGMHYIILIFMALMIFSFACHCLFNGKYYYIATNIQRLSRKSQKSEND